MRYQIFSREGYYRKKKRVNAGTFSFYLLSLSIMLLVVSMFFVAGQKKAKPDIETVAGAENSWVVELPPADDGQLFEDEDDESKPFVVEDTKDIILPFDLTAGAVYLYDLEKKETVYSKSADEIMSPASLTKIMTAVLTLEHIKDIEGVKITYRDYMTEELTHYDIDIEDMSNYGFKDGETVSIRDALYVLMLRSGNDAANLLAVNVGGTIEHFVDMMNEKAKELGAENTHFSNAHGLDAAGLYTTAYDMFLLTKYAMSLPYFMEIAESSIYTMPENSMRPEVAISTVIEMQNRINARSEIYYEYLRGIKTGYTDSAGRCLISSALRDGKNFLLILMGVPTKDKAGASVPYYTFYNETKEIYEWAFENW
jgi:D-alanyl-D-alanine carboxypeptidase (penicillin-binding protein 5/6)